MILDNLKDKCTTGNSYKLSSRHKLKSMIDSLKHDNFNLLKDATLKMQCVSNTT